MERGFQSLELEDENSKLVSDAVELSTDDESTGQRAHHQNVDINVQKIISNNQRLDFLRCTPCSELVFFLLFFLHAENQCLSCEN